MEIGLTDEIREKVNSRIPGINTRILEKSISIVYERDKAFKYTEQYVHSQSNKISAFSYFFNLVEVYNEIRYSTVSAECYRELIKSDIATEDEKREIGWRIKYYVESAIYRYYSFWEYVGRFFNEYFDLKLDVDKQDYSKEKDFYFARQVLNTVIKDYYHKILADILELWAKSKDVFDYRIVKTHKRNPRIGEKIFKITKEQNSKGRTLKLDIGKEYSGDDLLKLLMITHKHSRLTLELISDFFDLEQTVIKKNNLEENKSRIIIPSTKTILHFQKIIKPRKR